MYTTFCYSSSKFSKFIQGKSPLLQQLTSVSLLKEKSKICPKLTELLSWNGPTVRVWCFKLPRASTKTFVSRVQKQRKKSSLDEKFVSRVTRQPRYHCMWNSLKFFVTKLSLYCPASFPIKENRKFWTLWSSGARRWQG